MPVSTLAVAEQHYRYQAALIDQIDKRAAALWAVVDPHRLDEAWARVGPLLVRLVTAGQVAAAAAADGYVDAALQTQGAVGPAAAVVNTAALSGIASDGRDLAGLLLSSVITVRQLSTIGATIEQAVAAGLANLRMNVATQVADAGRVADQVASAARPAARHWVRMIEPGACSRCAILAGRVYRWKADFDRHPGCRCRAIPQAEAIDDLTTNPNAYFDSLSPAEQDRIFTKAGAEAIRHGADIAQVVNARRGMSTAQPAAFRESWARGRLTMVDLFGRRLAVTREGVTRRGLAGQRLSGRNGGIRLMPESIFQIATSKEDAVRLLREYGYIL